MRVFMVGGDDEAAGVGVFGANGVEPGLGLLKNGRQPVAVRIEGRTKSCAPVFARNGVAKGCLFQRAARVYPLHVAVEAGEVHRPNHPSFFEGFAISVLDVCDGLAVIAEGVADEWDRIVVATEWCSREE